MSYKRISGTPVSEGGTGNVTLTTAYGVLCAGTTATGAVQAISALGSSGDVLTSQGAGSLPHWVTPAAAGVTSIAGTANQITASASTGAVTLSTPSTFIAPGTIESTGTLTADTGFYLKRTTSSTVGVLFTQNVNSGGTVQNIPAMHFYGVPGGGSNSSNTFIGTGAGNFTLTQASARSNTTVGDGTPNDSTNHLIGNLGRLTSGAYNTTMGAACATAITSGSGNTVLGAYSGGNVSTGSDNLIIGAGIDIEAGSNYTGAEANNIIICNAGVAAETNVIRIGTSGSGAAQQNKAYIAGIYGIANSGTQNLAVIDSNNQIGSSTATSVTGSLTLTSFLSAGTLLKLPTTTSTVGQLTINAVPVLHTYGTLGNVFVGPSAGNFTLTSTNATCLGYQAGNALTAGPNNTYIGYQAGVVDAGSRGNHTAVGNGAMILYTGNSGASTECRNTCIGASTLSSLVSGSRNTAVGYSSGSGLTTTDSDNIFIGYNAVGTAGNNNVLVIGSGTGTGNGNLNKASICGINGITVTGTAVLVSSADQLGIAVSSRRFKENIEPMDSYSSPVMNLRPVTFNYTVGDDHSLQSGLIAEEVFDVMPSLVVMDKEGLPQTVKYHDLAVLLLNEIQKLSARITDLESKLLESRGV